MKLERDVSRLQVLFMNLRGEAERYPLPLLLPVSRISLVKPQKAQGITNLLIQMAQSGQIRQRVNEEQLIGLLEQVEQAQGDGPGGGQAGKITVS